MQSCGNPVNLRTCVMLSPNIHSVLPLMRGLQPGAQSQRTFVSLPKMLPSLELYRCKYLSHCP